MTRRKILEPLDEIHLEGFKNYELTSGPLTPRFNPNDNMRRLIVAVDLDAYAEKPPGRRFSTGTTKKVLEHADAVVIQLFTQTKRVRPKRLGMGAREAEHRDAIDIASGSANSILFVRTTTARLGHWLALAGHYGRDGALVVVLDSAGVIVVARGLYE